MRYFYLIIGLLFLLSLGGCTNQKQQTDSEWKLIGKILRTSKDYTISSIDKIEYKWYEYIFLKGEDTAYAAFDLNGNRLTPNSEILNGKPNQDNTNNASEESSESFHHENGDRPYYRGNKLFMCNTKKVDAFGEQIVEGYIDGECVFPSSLGAVGMASRSPHLIALCFHDEYGNGVGAIYDLQGEVIIPKEFGCGWFFQVWNRCIYGEKDKYVDGKEKTVYYTFTLDGKYYAEGRYNLNDPDKLQEFDAKREPTPWFKSETYTKPEPSPSADRIGEPGLLYRGDYTITSEFGDSYLTTISIYENYLDDGTMQYDYKSTNSTGRRVYSGSGAFGQYNAFYVNTETFDIRLVTEMSSPWGSSTSASTVTKGPSRMPASHNGNVLSGTNSNYQCQKHSHTENPVQPHQVTKDCPICNGSGKCSTCNGTHRIKYQFGSGTLECPNCKPNGACSSCGGSGKNTSTKYY